MHTTNTKALLRLRNNSNKAQTNCKTKYFNGQNGDFQITAATFKQHFRC